MKGLKVGLIGGSGLGQALLAQASGKEYFPRTPFGKPSAPIICTEWEGVPIAVLARHGVGHTLSPSNVPFQANIFALKKLGVTHILASGAAGSLREDVHPGSLVIPDQVIDKTWKRENSFFGKGIVAHVEFDRPFCSDLRRILLDAGKHMETRAKIHDGGTYVCMEGPQFSTVAESNLHRAWGGTLIGMTALPEAKLAREAEICYGLIAMPTDYDCWKPHPPGRDKHDLLAEIIGNMNQATQLAIQLIKAALRVLPKQADPDCPCRKSLEIGIWTDRSKIAPAVIRELEPLVGKYLGKVS